jgi:hypothetical protein
MQKNAKAENVNENTRIEMLETGACEMGKWVTENGPRRITTIILVETSPWQACGVSFDA